MRIKANNLWSIIAVVKISMGLTLGIYIFTFGPYFYDNFGGNANAATAIVLTTVLLAVRQGLVAALEVPTGALGDAIGRVNTVTLSLIFRMLFFLGLALLVLIDSVNVSFVVSIIASALFAFAYTFYSGSFTAWCIDSVRENKIDISYETILSKAYTFEFLFQVVGAVIGVAFYHYMMVHYAYLLAGFVCLVCIVFCKFKMEEVKSIEFISGSKLNFRKIFIRMKEIILVGLNICRDVKILIWLMISFALFVFLMSIVDYLWPIYLKSAINKNTTLYWMILAILAFIMNVLGSHSLTLLSKRWKNKDSSYNSKIRLRITFIIACIISSIPILL